jgi:hypothetical protein
MKYSRNDRVRIDPERRHEVAKTLCIDPAVCGGLVTSVHEFSMPHVQWDDGTYGWYYDFWLMPEETKDAGSS